MTNINFLNNSEKLKVLFIQGFTFSEISNRIGFSKNTVKRWAKKLNLHRHDRLIDKTDFIIKEYHLGKSSGEIGKLINCKPVSICTLLKRNNVKARGRRKYFSNEHFFDKIDTEHKAYILGWFYSDGCNFGNSLVLALIDREILEKIKSIFEFTGPIYIRERKNPKHKTVHVLSIRSRILSKRLSELGCPPNKTFSIKFPNDDIVPQNLKRHFIRGILDGDGCICCRKKKVRWDATICGTQNLVNGILNFININGRIVLHKKIYVLRYERKQSIKDFLDYIYKDATIYLKRKFDKYQAFLKYYFSKLPHQFLLASK